MNGVRVTPVTYLLILLHSRFADFEEESRFASITDMLAFTASSRRNSRCTFGQVRDGATTSSRRRTIHDEH